MVASNMANAATNPHIVIYGVGQYGSSVTRFAVQKGWPIMAVKSDRRQDRQGSRPGDQA